MATFTIYTQRFEPSFADIKKLPKLTDKYYIYIIENSNDKIKVGRSKNIAQRINSLGHSNSGGNSFIRVAISTPTKCKKAEKWIQGKFAKNNIKGSEWFEGVSFETMLMDSIEILEYLETRGIE